MSREFLLAISIARARERERERNGVPERERLSVFKNIIAMITGGRGEVIPPSSKRDASSSSASSPADRIDSASAIAASSLTRRYSIVKVDEGNRRDGRVGIALSRAPPSRLRVNK